MALRQPDKIKSNNPKEFGIVDAVEVSGHRVVMSDMDLTKIPDAILSPDGNKNNNAIGQSWYVTSQKCYYTLINWGYRRQTMGWQREKYYAKDLVGSRSVVDKSSLYKIQDEMLSLSGTNYEEDAIGQIWYVRDNKKYFKLKNWEFRHEEKGWEEVILSGVGEKNHESGGESLGGARYYLAKGRNSIVEGDCGGTGGLESVFSFTIDPKSIPGSNEIYVNLLNGRPFKSNDAFLAFDIETGYTKLYIVRYAFPKEEGLPQRVQLTESYKGERTKPVLSAFWDKGYSCAMSFASHVEGFNNITSNAYEHAQGFWNDSHKKTIDSVGIGDAEKRKNATETMDDGRHYIIGLGGYDGTNPDTAKSVQQVITSLTNRIEELERQLSQQVK